MLNASIIMSSKIFRLKRRSAHKHSRSLSGRIARRRTSCSGAPNGRRARSARRTRPLRAQAARTARTTSVARRRRCHNIHHRHKPRTHSSHLPIERPIEKRFYIQTEPPQVPESAHARRDDPVHAMAVMAALSQNPNRC